MAAVKRRSSDEPVKVCVVGPKGCGKTRVTRALADWDPLTLRYNPTIGLRIQEVERKLPRSLQARSIQLWDCSGDYRYQSCWPAMAKNAKGLLLVYSLDMETESSIRQKELERWYDEFVVPNKLPHSSCKIIAVSDDPQVPGHEFSGKLGLIQQEVVSLKDSTTWDKLFAALDSILGSMEEGDLTI